LGLALLLVKVFVLDEAQTWWTQRWILKDGQQGMAIVAKVRDHNSVVYRYRIDQKEFTGADFRDSGDPRYAHVGIGERTAIYFSSSHPWLSLIKLPRSQMPEGLPFLLLVWFVAARLFIAAIKPRSKWAYGPSTSADRHKV